MQVNRSQFRHGSILAGAVFLAFILMAGQAYAHDGNFDPAVIHACVQKSSNQVRIVGVTGSCTNAEVALHWSIAGPQGAQGPQGLQGPPGASSGGPPFVWVCTPANYDFGNNGTAEIDIFNGSGTTANITTHFLAKDGTNLSGANIPGTNPVAAYPGQTGNATVALGSQNTLILPYQTGAGFRATDNNLVASVSVTSDQPIVVGSEMSNGPPQAVPCNRLPQ